MSLVTLKELPKAVWHKLQRLPKTGDELYEKSEKRAEPLKGYAQMLLGVAVIVILVYQWIGRWHSLPLATVADKALTLVGVALAISAVVELAYTFFTRGPDEALDPLILGISSFALIKISSSSARLDNNQIVPLFLLALALFFLFLARRFLLPGLMGKAVGNEEPESVAPERPDQEHNPDKESLID
jgi:hypothetical protein